MARSVNMKVSSGLVGRLHATRPNLFQSNDTDHWHCLQGVKFASSTKSGDDSTSSTIDSRTPSPIPAQRPSAMTSKALSKASLPASMTKTSQVMKERTKPVIVTNTKKARRSGNEPKPPSPKRQRTRSSKAIQAVEPESPRPKRQRIPRTGKATVVYNAKWHPMDDVMNPKRAARVRNKTIKSSESVHSDIQLSESESEAQREDYDHGNIEVRPRSATRSPSPDRRRSRRTTGRSDAPNYSQKWVSFLGRWSTCY